MTTPQPELLAAWLQRRLEQGDRDAPPPEGLDPAVVEAVDALRPDLAPVPDIDLDALLDSLIDGPFAGAISPAELAEAAALRDVLAAGPLSAEAAADLDDDAFATLAALDPERLPVPALDLDDLIGAPAPPRAVDPDGPTQMVAAPVPPTAVIAPVPTPSEAAPALPPSVAAPAPLARPANRRRWALPFIGAVAMAATVLLVIGPQADRALESAPSPFDEAPTMEAEESADLAAGRRSAEARPASAPAATAASEVGQVAPVGAAPAPPSGGLADQKPAEVEAQRAAGPEADPSPDPSPDAPRDAADLSTLGYVDSTATRSPADADNRQQMADRGDAARPSSSSAPAKDKRSAAKGDAFRFAGEGAANTAEPEADANTLDDLTTNSGLLGGLAGGTTNTGGATNTGRAANTGGFEQAESAPAASPPPPAEERTREDRNLAPTTPTGGDGAARRTRDADLPPRPSASPAPRQAPEAEPVEALAEVEDAKMEKAKMEEAEMDEAEWSADLDDEAAAPVTEGTITDAPSRQRARPALGRTKRAPVGAAAQAPAVDQGGAAPASGDLEALRAAAWGVRVPPRPPAPTPEIAALQAADLAAEAAGDRAGRVSALRAQLDTTGAPDVVQDAAFRLARLQAAAGRTDLALATLARGLAVVGGAARRRAILYAQQGEILEQRGDLAGAATSYERATLTRR